jgi:hypothetical protein
MNLTNTETVTERNRRIFADKLEQFNGELNTRLKDFIFIKTFEIGSQEVTDSELKLMAKEVFIKELSRQLTNLL